MGWGTAREDLRVLSAFQKSLRRLIKVCRRALRRPPEGRPPHLKGKEKAPKAQRKFSPLFNYMLRIVGKSRSRGFFYLEVKEEIAFCFFTNFSLSDWLNSYLLFVDLPQNPCYHKPYSHTLPHQPACPNQPWQPCGKNPYICKEVSLAHPSPLLAFTLEP